MNIIPDIIIAKLKQEPSSPFDNHKCLSLKDIKCVHYVGLINIYKSYPSTTYYTYIALLEKEDPSHRYSASYSNGYELLTFNQSTYDSILKDEDIGMCSDYDLTKLKIILKTWTQEEIKIQVIFK